MPIHDQEEGDVQQHVLNVMSDGHIRVAVMGNVDAGKSTLIGTLCHAKLDDGNGGNRKLVTKFRHELDSGRTSTITQHLMAFDQNGETIVPPRNAGRYTEAHLAKHAHRTVSLMDVAGHEKYFKTTIAGLSRGMADYALVLVNASQGVTYMTAHHLSLAQMCGVPTVVVITKIDAAPPDVLRHTRQTVAEAIRAPDIGKKRYAVRQAADIERVRDKTHALVPVIEASCVTGGDGLDLLRQMLLSLPKRRQHWKKAKRPFEFLVEEQFNVPGVGLVLSGFVNAGRTKKGDSVFAGPTKDGTYVKAAIKSIHVAQTPVDEVWAGHSACFALALTKKQKSALAMDRKGLVLLAEPPAQPVTAFTAEICLAKGDSVTMVKGQTQTTLHILHLKQSCRLVDFEILDDLGMGSVQTTVLRPGQRAKATFKFLGGPQHVRTGMRVILRDGHVRGVGMIKEVHAASS